MLPTVPAAPLEAEAAEFRSSISRLRSKFPLALFAILWLDLIRLLSHQWEAREQYAYGWFVPFFGAALLWRRWQDRPAPLARPTPVWLLAMGWICVLALLPARVIYEVNPDWPLCSWCYTSMVLLVTLQAVWLAGGWSWVKHLCFPLALILVAVVWPWRLEKALTQGLMQVVASLTVELLGWADIPAIRHGNLIELGSCTVGIDEACSGIRSFQSSLMASLLMGELYRMRVWQRLTLVAGGLSLGFCFNVSRTLLLSWEANRSGVEVMEKWHDPAGMTITIFCTLALWGLAVVMRKWTATPRLAAMPARGGQAAMAGMANATSGSARGFLLAVGCWSICVLAGNELWYRAHEVKAPGVFYWSASFPTNYPSYIPIALTARVRKTLRHDLGDSGKWTEADGSEWAGYYFRWNPKSVESIISARLHRPDVCLPASGLKQVEDAGIASFEAHGLKLPFHRYVYDSATGPLFVFFCQWEDGRELQPGTESKQMDRLLTAFNGRRHLGQQTLELIILGYHSREEAERALQRRLPELIHLSEARVGT